jgi:hypothetical protein
MPKNPMAQVRSADPHSFMVSSLAQGKTFHHKGFSDTMMLAPLYLQ